MRQLGSKNSILWLSLENLTTQFPISGHVDFTLTYKGNNKIYCEPYTSMATSLNDEFSLVLVSQQPAVGIVLIDLYPKYRSREDPGL